MTRQTPLFFDQFVESTRIIFGLGLRISSGAVCRHLKIAGRVACFTIVSDYQPTPPNLQHIRKTASGKTIHPSGEPNGVRIIQPQGTTEATLEKIEIPK
jgi:hypothetical protein